MIRKLIVVAAAIVGLNAFAVTDSVFKNSKGAEIPYNSTGEIVRGEWTSQFAKAMAQAKSENAPVVIFWANEGCGHCAAVELEMTSKEFTTWMKKQQMYMVFICNNYPGPCGKEAAVAKIATRDNTGNYPFIGVYWKKYVYADKSTRTPLGTFTGNGMKAAGLMSKIMSYLGGYTPSVGGWFKYNAGVETEGHRYEAEAATKSVTLTLQRDSAKKSSTGTDQVKLYNGKTLVKTYTVNWAKGAVTTDIEVAIPAGLAAGKTLKAVVNGETKTKYITNIYIVEKAAGASNPKWVGESFGFGEWTCDIDGATKKVAGFVGGAAKAYTLVSVQGSMWCPDCANTDRNFLDLEDGEGKNMFQEWARSNHVMLVAMDVPNYNGASINDRATPTLFTQDAYATTLARAREWPASGAASKLTNAVVRSGLGYMSRKGITVAEGKTMLKKFYDLATKTPEKGGYHLYFGDGDPRNEDGNAYRTGVPIFVLLRRDGTVAARLTRLASVSPMKADQKNFANYIKRFDEMLKLADEDMSELKNNYPGANSIPLPLDGSVVTGRLCNADMRDTFKLAGFNGSANVKVTISGTSGAEVTAQFIIEKDGAFSNVGNPTNVMINKNAEIAGAFTDSGTCYLRISGADITSPDFDVKSATAGHFVEFEVKAGVASLIPQEKASTIPTTAGESVTLKVVSGVRYKIAGVKSVESGLLGPDASGLYAATVDGDAVVIADDSGSFTCQKWVPAALGFKVTSASCKDSVGKYTVKVQRTGGVSGPVAATLALDKEKTTLYYDHDTGTDDPRFTVDGVRKFSSKKLEWADGDGAEKSVVIAIDGDSKYYGDGVVAFNLTDPTNDVGDVTLAAGKEAFSLKVSETAEPVPSTIALASTSPAWSYSRTVYARRSEGVTLKLTRSDDGLTDKNRIVLDSSVATVAFTGDANLKKTSQYWDANDYEDKLVNVTKLPAAEKKTVITLKSGKGLFLADAAKNSVTIVSVDDEAPAFTAKSFGPVKLITYSTCYEIVAFDPATIKDGDKLSVELVSGSIPSGISAKIASGKLKFMGIPKAADKTTAFYRACATRDGKLIKGLPIKVTFEVVDPTTVDPDDPTYGKLSNTAVKSTRVLESLMVLSDEEPSRLAGTLNVTIPKTGKVTADYTGIGGRISFSATSWDAKDLACADSTLTATLTPSKDGYALKVLAYANGKVEAQLTDKYVKAGLAAVSYGKPWTAFSSGAQSWKGLYNAALVPGGTPILYGNLTKGALSGEVVEPENEEFEAPKGYGYIAFKMTSSTAYKAGKMTWAGKLPNGVAVSGSAVLTKGVTKTIGRTGLAYLPVFAKLANERLALVASIASDAAKNGGLRSVVGSPDLEDDLPLGSWTHKGDNDTGYSMDLHLFGSYYDAKKSLKDCCDENKVSTSQPMNVIQPAQAGYERYIGRGEPAEIKPLKIAIGTDAIKISSTGGNRSSLKFTIDLDRATGILSGTFQLYANGVKKYFPAAWNGVMLTGWGSECGCVDDDAMTLPFICGGFSFDDKLSTGAVLSGGSIYTGPVISVEGN